MDAEVATFAKHSNASLDEANVLQGWTGRARKRSNRRPKLIENAQELLPPWKVQEIGRMQS